MVRKLIELALNNPLVVILLALALAGIGVYSFLNVNVEAYPDPAPAIVEVVAQMPGASAEEVERQVTIPLEVTFAGMPGLKHIRSQSLFGLSDLKMNWHYDSRWTYETCRQEVINRLSTISQPLPPNVTPGISPESPTGEIYRYILRVPKEDPNDPTSRWLYTRNDIKALQDWVLERDFRTVQRIVDVTSFGGTVRRYEVQPDPDRLRRYGVTLPQLQTALTNSNTTVGGDYVNQGQVAFTVRSVGLFGGGMDPVNKVLGFEIREAESYLAGHDLTDEQKQHIRAALARRRVEKPLTGVDGFLAGFKGMLGLERPKVDFPLTDEERRHVQAIEQRAALRATTILRSEEQRRIRDIRSLVIASINNQPIRVEDVVEGGRVYSGANAGERGVTVRYQTRLGRIGYWKADRERPPGSKLTLADVGYDQDDMVQCIVLLRKGEDTLPALTDVKKKVEELNDPANGRMLPGVAIEPYYDRSELLHLTTETVTENLGMGVLLVVVILFMFVSNIRTAVIVAVNIPLALLFAFSMLYLRGKSANLLSIGAVDFGIIVDSSVIMVENIYRCLATGEYAELPIKERILRSTRQIDHALLFSTLIMMCAFVPLFTMSGPEGMLFAPMAQTYAFSLGGALVLATTLTPVLAMFLFKNMKPAPENLLVRALKFRYFWKLKICLKYRYTTIVVLLTLIVGTCALIPRLGREFMPELEEGNLWIRCTAPLNWTLERNVEVARKARAIMATYPEVEAIVSQSGRPDDGTDTAGFYNTEYFVPLRPEKDWPKLIDQAGWRSWLWGSKRERTKQEIIAAMNAELEEKIPGVVWNFSQNIRDNVMEAMSGVKGDNSVKVFGPDLDRLEVLATKVKNVLEGIRGIENVGIFHVRGQSHLEFRVDPEKCQRWGVATADVNNVVSSALGAAPQSNMVEGEKLFNIAIRWPLVLRSSETSILDIPVDIVNNQIVLPQSASSVVPWSSGNQFAPVNPAGTNFRTDNPITAQAPRLRLRDLVTPVGPDGAPDPDGSFERAGASDIYRENGKRMIAIKFSVRGRDLGGTVDEAREKTKDLFEAPYRAVWSGEFEEMEDAEKRLLVIVPLSLGLIFILLYMAFHSILDTLVVFSNVFDVAVGGIWALYLTNTNFSISAAVGFVSLFGVAIMEGLLLVSYFNALRAQGLPLEEAIVQGATKRVRPVMITAMTAILGLLPAALSTRIGSQTQKPLAIVVVGGMSVTLLLDRYLMPVLYSFYGHREPPEGSGSLAH
jgi:cobalt-zinc-cadmium resistance protein CzcA